MSEQRDLMAGRYRLQHRIGSGGMGHVWLAWDERLNRAVAIKQLRALADLPEGEAAVAHQRAMREARITARLEHPNAVPVFDVMDHDGQPCLVMQYVPSRASTRSSVRERDAHARAASRKIGAEIASALAAAHATRIVHRDVKPGNILVTEDGSAMISDFGISQAFGDTSLTSTGMLDRHPRLPRSRAGPGASSEPASDVFSLGSTLYAAVEGTPPFGAGENPMALLHQVASGKIEPPRLAGALSGVLLAMLDVDPERRPTMQQASEMLARLASGGGTTPDGDRERPQSTKVLPVVGAAGRGGGSSSGRRGSGGRGRGTDGGSRRGSCGCGCGWGAGVRGWPHRRAAERPARTRRGPDRCTTTSGTDRGSGTCPAGCGSSSRATGPAAGRSRRPATPAPPKGGRAGGCSRAPDPRRLGGPARRSSGRRGRAGAQRHGSELDRALVRADLGVAGPVDDPPAVLAHLGGHADDQATVTEHDGRTVPDDRGQRGRDRERPEQGGPRLLRPAPR